MSADDMARDPFVAAAEDVVLDQLVAIYEQSIALGTDDICHAGDALEAEELRCVVIACLTRGVAGERISPVED